MAVLKEIETMDSKDIYVFIKDKENELTLLRSKVMEIENELVPYRHVQSIRTTTRAEKDAWEREIREIENG